MLAARTVDAEALYLANRTEIDRAIALVCRRAHASHADAEEFASVAHLRLIDDNYRVLRAYEGRAEIGAFLQAVIRRLFQDWRNEHWGRWRPSLAARREGPAAVLLETLTIRDDVPLDQAIVMMRTNHGVADSEQALRALHDRLPVRTVRTFERLEALDDRPAESGGDPIAADDLVRRRDIRAAAERLSMALDRVLEDLPPADRLLLRMRFESGHPVATIARVLNVEPHVTRRRIEKLLAAIRAALAAAGVTASDAADVIARRGFDMIDAPALPAAGIQGGPER